MAKVFLSFLGLGVFEEKTGEWNYKKGVYELNNRVSGETEFVQAAELEILGVENFDRILIIATQKSYETHFEKLKKQLENLGVKTVTPVIISEEMSSEGQWEWFERILAEIKPEDSLSADLTHGYRSFPIVFSTAVHFLQRAKKIRLDAVYYGAFDKDRKLTPIVNLKDFYMINEWAEAVSRLVEDADAGKMAEVAEKAPAFQSAELNERGLVETFETLTGAIKNVEINRVAELANDAVTRIKATEENASPTGKTLLGILREKFEPITTEKKPDGSYDQEYFKTQLIFIELLLEHKLFMQAYTAMREMIGSIGMLQHRGVKYTNAKGRKKRKYAEVFVNMIRVNQDDWNFMGDNAKMKDNLEPFYARLKTAGVIDILQSMIKDLLKYRNGFDHAWTIDPQAMEDMDSNGKVFLEKFRDVIDIMSQLGFFNT
ncbi:MAG: TIGR02221 family CRISPR-associated protein [Deltaproteobacteria bacterium]|nr:TIGR02221 family CRISPR-associated protein [Deltaproteobacteria bacterium]